MKKGRKVEATTQTTKQPFSHQAMHEHRKENYMAHSSKSKASAQFLTQISDDKKDHQLEKNRSKTQDIEAIFKTGEAEFHQKQSKRLQKCTGRLDYSWDIDQATGSMKLKLKKASFCKCRTCPQCQVRRQYVWRIRAINMMPKILELYPNHKWLLLTLTVQNMPVNQLKDAVRHMQAAWQRLRQRKAFPAIGYIKSLEVTRQESNGFAHPHFHVLMLVPSGYFSHGYIKQYDWRKMWMEALRADYLPSVNIKAVKSKNPKDPHDITSAIIEVLKYETKMLDLEKHPDFLLELAMQLHKSRAVEVGGVLKELIKEEISDDDLLLQSDEDKLEDLKKMMTFTWQRGIRRYQKLD